MERELRLPHESENVCGQRRRWPRLLASRRQGVEGSVQLTGGILGCLEAEPRPAQQLLAIGLAN